jgi:predicted ATPase
MPKRSAGHSKQHAHFSHLYLENWRNFVRVDTPLQRRMFLVGPNAAGKSNLLDVFRFLHDMVAVGGGFQEAVRKRGGVSQIRCLAARRYPDVRIRLKVSCSDGSAPWEYDLCFKQDKNRTPLIRSEMVKRGTTILVERPDAEDLDDPARLTQSFIEQVNVNREFRELTEFFGSVRYLHIVPHLVREPERSIGRKNDPFGGDFLEQVATTPKRTRDARLRRIRETLAVAVPQLQALELSRDDRGTAHLKGNYKHWRPSGAWQTESDFSDGTLRMVGLLWALLAGRGPLLLEEPELSLHPEIVRHIPQMFARVQRSKGRQILASTQSPDLLRDDGIGLDEVLLLRPTPEGTRVADASHFSEIRMLLESGHDMAEAVIPHTSPSVGDQLTLFGE